MWPLKTKPKLPTQRHLNTPPPQHTTAPQPTHNKNNNDQNASQKTSTKRYIVFFQRTALHLLSCKRTPDHCEQTRCTTPLNARLTRSHT